MTQRQNIRLAAVVQKYPPYIAGAERQTQLLVHLLAESGEYSRCEVITTRIKSDLPRRCNEGSVNVIRLPTFFSGNGRLVINFFTAFLYFAFKGYRYDVIHTTCLSPFVLGAIMGGSLWRRPSIVKPCTAGECGDIATVKNSWLGSLMWNIFKRSRIFIAATPQIAKELERHKVCSKKIAIIPNLVNPSIMTNTDSRSRASVRAELGLPERPTALFVGRIVPQKQVDRLVSAWCKIAHSRNATLVLVGDGPELTQIKEFVRKNECEDSVVAVGWQQDPCMYYRAADIFAFTARDEAFGNVLAEAMAYGLAVVTTRVGLVPQWIQDGENGLIVEETEESIAEGLSRVINDRNLRQRLGRNAHDQAVRAFGPESIGTRFAALHRTV